MPVVLVCVLLWPSAGPPLGPYSRLVGSRGRAAADIAPLLYPAGRVESASSPAYSWHNGVTLSMNAVIETRDRFEAVVEHYETRWGVPAGPGRHRLADGSTVHHVEELLLLPPAVTRRGVNAFGVLLVHSGPDWVRTVRIASSLTGKGTVIQVSLARTHDDPRPLPAREAEALAYLAARDPARTRKAYEGRRMVLEGTAESKALKEGLAELRLVGFKEGGKRVGVICLLDQDAPGFRARFEGLKPGAVVRVQGFVGIEADAVRLVRASIVD